MAKTYYPWEVLCCVYGVPINYVRAAHWMKALGAGSSKTYGTKTRWKNHLKEMAQRLYPTQKIRAKLKEIGISRLDVSVKCNRDYTIHCFNKTKKISHDNLMAIVASVYYQEDHHWLCVMVDHHWLPMEKPKNATQEIAEERVVKAIKAAPHKIKVEK